MAAELKELGTTAEDLAVLREHYAWPTLRKVYEERKERQVRSLLSRLLARPDQAVLQKDLDYFAGFFAGCEWLLKSPDLSQASLAEAVERAERRSVE